MASPTPNPPPPASLLETQARVRAAAEEQASALGDFASWMRGMSAKESARGARTATAAVTTTAAPVRGGGKPAIKPPDLFMPPPAVGGGTGKEATGPAATEGPTPASTSAAAHTYDKGYKKWERFDVEGALAAVEADAGSRSTHTTMSPAPSPAPSPASGVGRGGGVVIPVRAGPQRSRGDDTEAREAGNECYKRGNYHAAIQHYSRAVVINPDSVAAYSNRAQCYMQVREWRKAVEDATCALSLDPYHVKSWLRRAASRNALGQHVAAARDLEVALKLEPGNREGAAELRKTREAQKACSKRVPATVIPVTTRLRDGPGDGHACSAADGGWISLSGVDDAATQAAYSGPIVVVLPAAASGSTPATGRTKEESTAIATAAGGRGGDVGGGGLAAIAEHWNEEGEEEDGRQGSGGMMEEKAARPGGGAMVGAGASMRPPPATQPATQPATSMPTSRADHESAPVPTTSPTPTTVPRRPAATPMAPVRSAYEFECHWRSLHHQPAARAALLLHRVPPAAWRALYPLPMDIDLFCDIMAVLDQVAQGALVPGEVGDAGSTPASASPLRTTVEGLLQMGGLPLLASMLAPGDEALVVRVLTAAGGEGDGVGGSLLSQWARAIGK